MIVVIGTSTGGERGGGDTGTGERRDFNRGEKGGTSKKEVGKGKQGTSTEGRDEGQEKPQSQ